MQRQDIIQLLNKYNTGTCSESEKALVEDWYLQFELKGIDDLADQEREADLDKILKALPVHRPRFTSKVIGDLSKHCIESLWIFSSCLSRRTEIPSVISKIWFKMNQ